MKTLAELEADVMNLALPIGFAVIAETPMLEILYANEVFVSMLGFPDRESLLRAYGHSAWDCIYAEDLERLKQAAPTRVGTFEAYEISYRAIKKDGSLLWVCQNSRHTLDENGTELIFAYYTDITAQKHLEERIRAGVEQYETLVNSVPGGVGMYRLDAGFSPVFMSDSAYGLCNMTRAEYCAASRGSTLNMFYPDDRQGFLDTVQVARETDGRFDYTHRVLQKDGSYRWMRVSGQVLTGQDGEQLLYTVFTDVHEQLQAERALRESEFRYAAAVKAANINIWEYDYATDAMTIFSKSPKVNPQGNIVRNYTKTAIEEGHIREDCAPLLLCMIEKLKNGAKEVTEDLWIRQNREDDFWCERVVYTNTFDEMGKPVRAYCIGRDITREKEAEKRYLDERSYREAMQKATMASINVNLTQNTILDYKSIFAEITANMEAAKTVQDYFDHLYTELSTPEMQRQCAAVFNREGLLRQFTNGKTTQSLELTREIGTRRYWTIMTAHMMKKENGDIVAFLYSTDVTGERTMQNIMNAIATTDYDFLVVVDARRDTALRYSEKDAGHSYTAESLHFEQETQEYLRSYLCPEDVSRALEEVTLKNILAQLESQSSYNIFYGVPTDGGKILRKQLSFRYISREEKSILMTRVDITAAVEEQEKKNRELTAAVKMAERANAAKSDFLSRISHELRTPMNAIMGMNQIALQQLSDTALVGECIEKSQYASRYLLQLLGDILDMSKIESGKVTLKTEEMVCELFLDAISTIIDTQAAAKGVRYEVTKFAGCKKSYLGDSVRLQQILINILTNAVKFTSAGGTVHLDIAQLYADETTAQICFTISDTGIGISREFLPDIFKPFAQEQSGTRAGYGGSGLGLAISKNLAEMMGGDILVESVKGQGTTFRVQIPMGIPARDASSDAAQVARIPPAQYDFSGKKILLVEDHPLNIMVARRLLEFKNAAVEVAENGEIGLAHFSAAPEAYDAVLMDIRMPVMDGLEAAERIRSLHSPWAKKVPIIAMSANAFDEDVEKSQKAGMNAHLAKPIEAELLYRTLAAFLYKNGEKTEDPHG